MKIRSSDKFKVHNAKTTNYSLHKCIQMIQNQLIALANLIPLTFGEENISLRKLSKKIQTLFQKLILGSFLAISLF